VKVSFGIIGKSDGHDNFIATPFSTLNKIIRLFLTFASGTDNKTTAHDAASGGFTYVDYRQRNDVKIYSKAVKTN
jgi:hypothetical protein